MPTEIWENPTSEEIQAYQDFLEAWEADDSAYGEYEKSLGRTLSALATCTTFGSDAQEGNNVVLLLDAEGDDGNWWSNGAFFPNQGVEFGGSDEPVYLFGGLDENIFSALAALSLSGWACYAVNVPKGATINHAFFRFNPEGTSGGAICNVIIDAEDADDPSAPTNYSEATGSFDRTTNAVEWNSVPTFVGMADNDSPNVACIVQELVDRSGWVSGNNMCFYFTDNTSDNGALRITEEGQTSLHIWYTLEEEGSGGVVVGGSSFQQHDQTGDGGAIGSGDGDSYAIYNPDSTGGVILNGSGENTVEYTDVSDGGVVLAGASDLQQIMSEESNGGAVAGGTTTQVYDIDGTGGILSSGTADANANYNPQVTGGIVAAGNGPDTIESFYTSENGTILSGEAEDQHAMLEPTSGGAIVSGAADENSGKFIEVSGGGIASGEADIYVSYNPSVSNGANLGGQEESTHDSSKTGDGGSIASGVAETDFTDYIETSGGVVLSGEAINTSGDFFVADGGATVSGAADNSIAQVEISDGGATASGAADNIHDISEISDGGATVSGTADNTHDVSETSDGGATASGEAEEDQANYFNPSGGATASGEADNGQFYAKVADGGAVVSGEAIVVSDGQEVVEGGVTANGTANNTEIMHETPSGGGIVSGQATKGSEQDVEADGGATVNGITEYFIITSYINDGGTTVNGSAEVELISNTVVPSGGIVGSGSADANFVFSPTTSGGGDVGGKSSLAENINVGGGVVVNGVSVIEIGYIAQGGAVVSGATDIDTILNPIPSGGVIVLGHAAMYFDNEGSGGVVCSGFVPLWGDLIYEIAAGGALVSISSVLSADVSLEIVSCRPGRYICSPLGEDNYCIKFINHHSDGSLPKKGTDNTEAYLPAITMCLMGVKEEYRGIYIRDGGIEPITYRSREEHLQEIAETEEQIQEAVLSLLSTAEVPLDQIQLTIQGVPKQKENVKSAVESVVESVIKTSGGAPKKTTLTKPKNTPQMASLKEHKPRRSQNKPTETKRATGRVPIAPVKPNSKKIQTAL